MPYHYILQTRAIELIECEEPGRYNVFWEDLPVGFVYKLEIGINAGDIVWAGSSPFLNLHAEEIGSYIQQCTM
jgi:hypothetical protein